MRVQYNVQCERLNELKTWVPGNKIPHPQLGQLATVCRWVHDLMVSAGVPGVTCVNPAVIRTLVKEVCQRHLCSGLGLGRSPGQGLGLQGQTRGPSPYQQPAVEPPALSPLLAGEEAVQLLAYCLSDVFTLQPEVHPPAPAATPAKMYPPPPGISQAEWTVLTAEEAPAAQAVQAMVRGPGPQPGSAMPPPGTGGIGLPRPAPATLNQQGAAQEGGMGPALLDGLNTLAQHPGLQVGPSIRGMISYNTFHGRARCQGVWALCHLKHKYSFVSEL